MASEVAPKTVDFAKAWVWGLFTKRQYQNWYIVKTKDTEFVLTLTEKRELYAMKDRKTGHVFLWDSALEYIRDGRLSGGMDNPFNVLIRDGFQFPNGYTRLNDRYGHLYDEKEQGAGADVRTIMSKFRLCDRITLKTKVGEMNISLIALGDRRFYTAPLISRAGKSVSLEDWATFKYEASLPNDNPYHNYKLTEIFHRDGIEKVADIRGHYMDVAGDMLPKATANESSWIQFPTSAITIDELAGCDFLKAKQSRPNPYNYHINPSLADFSKLSRRHETIAENADHLRECLHLDGDIHRDFTSSEWKDHLHKHLPADMAQRYVAYFMADDEWLEQHRKVARAGHLEYLLRENSVPVQGWIYLRAATDTRFGPYEIYMRGTSDTEFQRYLPSPMYYNKVFGGELGGFPAADEGG